MVFWRRLFPTVNKVELVVKKVERVVTKVELAVFKVKESHRQVVV